jgi:hypothetical protein
VEGAKKDTEEVLPTVRRIRMVFAVLAVMGLMFATFASPAMAQSAADYSCGYYDDWGYYYDCWYYYPQTSGFIQTPSQSYEAGSDVNNAGSVTP